MQEQKYGIITKWLFLDIPAKDAETGPNGQSTWQITPSTDNLAWANLTSEEDIKSMGLTPSADDLQSAILEGLCELLEKSKKNTKLMHERICTQEVLIATMDVPHTIIARLTPCAVHVWRQGKTTEIEIDHVLQRSEDA